MYDEGANTLMFYGFIAQEKGETLLYGWISGVRGVAFFLCIDYNFGGSLRGIGHHSVNPCTNTMYDTYVLVL